MNDGEILNLLNSRNENAVSALTERYGGLCRSLIGNILSDDRDIEECMNSVFMRLWSSIPPAKPDNLTAYVAKAARNEALMRYRSNKRHDKEELSPMDEIRGVLPSADSEAIAKELRENVEKYLKGLSKEKRGIFIRRYWFFDPVREIARLYGMSESKVTSMLFRIRNGLREYLRKEGLL